MSDPLTQTQETIPASWRGGTHTTTASEEEEGVLPLPTWDSHSGSLGAHHPPFWAQGDPTESYNPAGAITPTPARIRAWPSLTPPPVRKGIF